MTLAANDIPMVILIITKANTCALNVVEILVDLEMIVDEGELLLLVDESSVAVLLVLDNLKSEED